MSIEEIQIGDGIKYQNRYGKVCKINGENPEQYEELDRLEAETGFTMSITGVRVRDIVKKA